MEHLKNSGIALLPFKNLPHTIAEQEVMLTWALPTSYHDETVQPVSFQVRISVDGQNAVTHVLENAPESYIFFPYDPKGIIDLR